LIFHCVCLNGTTPNVALYENTIPFYVCTANYGQCIKNNPNDLDAQQQCKNNAANCGSLNASTPTTSTTTSISATTLATGTTVATATATNASASAATSKAAAIALQAAQDHSTGLLVAALLAAARILL
jgi:activator of HSP90 ATPase